MKSWVLEIVGLMGLLLTGCSEKVYLRPECPYIEPVDVDIVTMPNGGLDPLNAYKAVTALQYQSKEIRRLKRFVKGSE